MGPTSIALIVALIAAATGLLVALVRARFLVLRIAAGALAMVLAMTTGIAVVNDFYGYYRTWSDLAKDFGGQSNLSSTFSNEAAVKGQTGVAHGQVEKVTLAGKVSGISRSAYVYLPPQYRQSAYRAERFPVLELLHGSPGKPADWLLSLHLKAMLDQMIADHLMGPMVVVMPTVTPLRQYQECLDAGGVQDMTYVAQDVPMDIMNKYRVTRDTAQWGLAGYSSGGYCAANVALHYRSSFGAVASLDGYYQASDGPAAARLSHAADLMAQNSPVDEVSSVSSTPGPLPAFWLSAGTGDPDALRQQRLFAHALEPVVNPTLVYAKQQSHNFYNWQLEMPTALGWLWQELATPDQRANYPIAGGHGHLTLPSPYAHKHRTTTPRRGVPATGKAGIVAHAPPVVEAAGPNPHTTHPPAS